MIETKKFVLGCDEVGYGSTNHIVAICNMG